MKLKTTITRETRKRARLTTKRIKGTWERLTLDMNETQQKIVQVRRMIRLQPWPFASHPPHQGSSTTCPIMTTTPLTFIL
jgi:hypothetical protein